MVLVIKNPPANAEDLREADLTPGLGRSPGGGHSSPLQYSCLENPMDRGACWVTVHRVSKTQTQLKHLSTHTHTHILLKPWKEPIQAHHVFPGGFGYHSSPGFSNDCQLPHSVCPKEMVKSHSLRKRRFISGQGVFIYSVVLLLLLLLLSRFSHVRLCVTP